MDNVNHEFINLKEWSPLSNLLSKIPEKLQKNLFYQDLEITCVDAIKEFIAVGTNLGIVLWYNRTADTIQKLRTEISSSIACVKIVSSVEYMIAAGSSSGQITIFQVQKEFPAELHFIPLTKQKPIERFTIKELHRSTIQCLEWSKNGMKLFSGDNQGIIGLTEIDYQIHACNSSEILNEAYEIIQIRFQHPYLLISSIYRAIVCQKDESGSWKVCQVGKKDRKLFSDFGITFINGSNKQPVILTSRPGYRLWLSDVEGNVSQTLIFKDAVKLPTYIVPLLNPRKTATKLPLNFGRVYPYKEKYALTYTENNIFILNLEKLTVEALITGLRRIICLAVHDDEIFILESSRCLLRISTKPEGSFGMAMTNSINFTITNPAHLFSVPTIETDAETELIVKAEECFELPPIMQLNLNEISRIELNNSAGTSQQEKKSLLLEHSKKVELFDKIDIHQYDDSILYKSKTHKKHKHSGKTNKGFEGIVEIGQQATVIENKEVTDENIPKEAEIKNDLKEVTTKPSLLDVSFFEYVSKPPDLRSPDTLQKEVESKEKILAAKLNLNPVKLEKNEITPDEAKSSNLMLKKDIWQYSNDYMNQMISLRKKHFINDESPTSDDDKLLTVFPNLSDDDKKKAMIKSDHQINSTIHTRQNVMSKSTNEMDQMEPKVVKISDLMNIPNLWNISAVPENNNTEVDDPVKQVKDSPDSDEWEML